MSFSGRITSSRNLLHAVLMTGMLLGSSSWFSPLNRAEADEAPQEVKKCTEVAVLCQVRRRDGQTSSYSFFRSGRCLSQSCLERRTPRSQWVGHRLTHELLAPLIC